MEAKNILELLPDNPYIQYGFAFCYTGLLAMLLVWAIRKGSQMTKITPREYLTESTDEIFMKGLETKKVV